MSSRFFRARYWRGRSAELFAADWPVWKAAPRVENLTAVMAKERANCDFRVPLDADEFVIPGPA
jgi:hypothetical protein